MTVRLFLDVPDRVRTRAEYALGVLFDGIGVPTVAATSASEADLVYGRDAALLKAVDAYDWDLEATDIVHLDGMPVITPRGCRTPDIVFSTYSYLIGVPERDQPRDPWGVPICRNGSFGSFGLLSTPVIARYTEWLEQRLAPSLLAGRVARWPRGKKTAVILSHDVDAPFSGVLPGFAASHLRALASRGQWGRLPRAAGRLTKSILRYRRPESDPNLRFGEWVDLARHLGGNATFYVAVRSCADPLATEIDVAYDFRHPALLGELRKAAERGAEIGVHASTAARLSPEAMAEEREWLRSALGGAEVTGVRHHYWATDPELPERTSWLHAAAGFEYDSSFGLNDVPGFRRGMVWPYVPFDRERGVATPILEVPPTLMDGGIFYRDVTPEEGEAEIREHVQEVFARGGAVVLDWHMEQLNPARLRRAGPVVTRVLRDLAGDSDIFWASAAELARWWRERRALIEARGRG